MSRRTLSRPTSFALGVLLVALVGGANGRAFAESLPEATTPSAPTEPPPPASAPSSAPAGAEASGADGAPSDTSPPAAPGASKRVAPPGFESVSGSPQDEKVDAGMLVIIAYATFFVFMFGYIVVLARKQAEMAVELSLLAQRIAAREKSSDKER